MSDELEVLRAGGRRVRLFKRSLRAYLQACAGGDVSLAEALRRSRISAAARLRAHEKREKDSITCQTEDSDRV